jgi:hypothetical protein
MKEIVELRISSNEELFRENVLKLSKKAMERWKNLVQPPSIYRERGVASGNRFDMTVASF